MTDTDHRDAHGRFTKGYTPSTGFHTNPERRYRFPNRGRSFQLAAQKYMDMTDTQVREQLALANSGELSQAQQLALQLIAQAKDAGNPKQLSALQILLDRVEGKPQQQEEKEEAEGYVPPQIVLRFIGDGSEGELPEGLP